MSARGFFAIGVYHPKCGANIGTLWRSANLYGAAFLFTIGRRYQRQSSDTMKTDLHVPLYHYTTMDECLAHLPLGAQTVGIELHSRARPLAQYGHPLRAVYLLGAEDHGLPPDMIERCHSVVQIESALPRSMNVAAAGSVVMWHRHTSGVCRARVAA